MGVTLPAWTRDTPWRQGHVLPAQAAKELGLYHPTLAELTCVVVISHDCDLASEDLNAEPDVEVVIGTFPNQGDGNFYWAKSARTLHLHAQRDSEPVVIELVTTGKCLVSKQALAAFTPDPRYTLTGASRDSLRSWLAVRYNRAAFADLFVSRLSETKIDKKLAKLIEPVGEWLSAVYFDIDSGRELEHSDGSPFDLKIVLVYPPGDDPDVRGEEMDALAERVADLFAKKFFTTGIWVGISMKTCMAICEDDITIGRAKLLTQWRLEHMTLKALAEGE